MTQSIEINVKKLFITTFGKLQNFTLYNLTHKSYNYIIYIRIKQTYAT